MKGSVVVTTVLLAGALALAAPGETQRADGRTNVADGGQLKPLLTVEESRIDLGEIKAGTVAVGTFVFHNAGDIDVKIIRAKPS